MSDVFKDKENPKPSIALFNFSPRTKGNCSIVADMLLEQFRDRVTIDYLIVPQMHIVPCGQNCNQQCMDTGNCVQTDDMERIYPLLERSNLIVIITPVYFLHVPAQGKALIDRCQPYWVRAQRTGNIDSLPKINSNVIIGATGYQKMFSGIRGSIRSALKYVNCSFSESHDMYLNKIDRKGEVLKEKETINTYLQTIAGIIDSF